MKNTIQKTFIALALTSAVSTSMANSCVGEAQITATVDYVSKSFDTCYVGFKKESVKFFQPSGVCPLALSEVLQSGIDVGSTPLAGTDTTICNYSVGQVFSGIIEKNQSGAIYPAQ